MVALRHLDTEGHNIASHAVEDVGLINGVRVGSIKREVLREAVVVLLMVADEVVLQHGDVDGGLVGAAVLVLIVVGQLELASAREGEDVVREVNGFACGGIQIAVAAAFRDGLQLDGFGDEDSVVAVFGLQPSDLGQGWNGNLKGFRLKLTEAVTGGVANRVAARVGKGGGADRQLGLRGSGDLLAVLVPLERPRAHVGLGRIRNNVKRNLAFLADQLGAFDGHALGGGVHLEAQLLGEGAVDVGQLGAVLPDAGRVEHLAVGPVLIGE